MSIFNYDSANQRAALYRINMLPGEIDATEDQITSIAMSFMNEASNYRFYTLRRVLSANDFVSSYRNLLYALYAIDLHIEEIEQKEAFFFNETSNWFKKLNKDIKVLKDQVKENGLRLRNPNTKTKIKSVFSERETRSRYDLVDYKTGIAFRSADQISYKHDGLQTKEIFKEKLEVVNVELAGSESYLGEGLILSKNQNPRNILSTSKVFNHIVGRPSSPREGALIKEVPATVTLILSFNGKELLNNLYIETASMLPLVLEQDDIKYWNGTSWVAIQNTSSVDEYNRWQVFFDEVYTDKIKVTLHQYKSIQLVQASDTSDALDRLIYSSFIEEYPVLNTTNYDIYDLSINTIDAYYYANSSIGIYRDSESLDFKKGYSANLTLDYLVEEDSCFVEKSLELDSYTYGNLTSSYIVPLPSSSLKQKEVLVFNKREAKLLFPKNSQPLLLKRGDVSLILNQDYKVEIEGASGSTRTGDALTLDTKITLLRSNNLKGAYTVEYSAESEFYLRENKNIKYKDGTISFFIGSGRVRPRVVIRNLNQNNRSSIISSYRLSVEEVERTDEEDFIYNNDIIER